VTLSDYTSLAIMHAGSNRQACPIEGLAYRDIPSVAGLKSRARGRAVKSRNVEVWLNRVISILRQLWAGKLNDDLLATDAGAWSHGPPQHVEPSSLGERLIPELRACVRRTLDSRPENFPSGAAALQRQLGVGQMAPGPPREGKKTGSASAQRTLATPNRGDIWPASIDHIALPPAGTRLIPLTQVSSTAAAYLEAFETSMLRPLEERQQLLRQSDRAPYVDPLIRRDILKLAARMASAGMLRGVTRRQSTVGMFTVVKKVVETDEYSADGSLVWPAGTILLRLVLDQRIPNLAWKEPPWVALGGPGALSSVDLSGFGPPGSVQICMATGDIPDYYYRLGLPDAISEWFCLPDVTMQSLTAELESQGRADVAQQLLASTPTAEYVGLVAPAMGWSWAVFLAQSTLQDLIAGVRSRFGEPVWCPTRALVEGAPPPTLNPSSNRVHSEYIDDYFLLLARSSDAGGAISEDMRELSSHVRAHLNEIGFPVHKEEFGEEVSSLGHSVGGDPPRSLGCVHLLRRGGLP
jgi:hypothetical protein